MLPNAKPRSARFKNCTRLRRPKSDDSGTRTSIDGRNIHIALSGIGSLGQSLLVLIHCVRRIESTSIRHHQLVPSDVPLEKGGIARVITAGTSSLPETAGLVDKLVEQRFPVGRNPPRGSRDGLMFGMCMWRKQLRARDHSLLFIIEKPIFSRLKAGDNRMARFPRMLRGMLTRRAVTTADVSAFSASAKMKPPPVRRCQALYAPVAARL